MKKSNSYIPKVFDGEQVYLPADSCAKILGLHSGEELLSKYPDLEKSIPGFSGLITEADYNQLLLQSKEALARQIHIEITKAQTLGAKTETLWQIYPLKRMMAPEWFREKAIEKACASVEEFIEQYDFPEECRKALEELRSSKTLSEQYGRDLEWISDPENIDIDRLSDCGLKIQCLTSIDGSAHMSLSCYLAGKGVFYQISDSGDEIYTEMERINNDEIVMPMLETNEYRIRALGKDLSGRDFRKFNVVQNLQWLLNQKDLSFEHSFFYTAGPGLHAYIDLETACKLMNPNLFRGYLLIGGVLEPREQVYITDPGGEKVFMWDLEDDIG